MVKEHSAPSVLLCSSFRKLPKIDRAIVFREYKAKKKECASCFTPNTMVGEHPLIISLLAGLWKPFTFVFLVKE